ncbi:IPT/TIG domain-containing protein [Bacteroides congonensis]|uniref:IPT/TIG domain-containing protein n=1 Tax=Bacteroides congonensis TaxID=1871006 RepID=UPI00189DA592|nr:IPT/TIG domain-containing protein [Bacteroides congonensis]
MKNSILILSILFCCNLLCGCSDSDETDSRQFPPKLISIIPKAGSTGGTAIISGVYFSETVTDNKVFINGVQAEISDATNNRLVITLPDNPNGEYTVKVSVKEQTVEGLKITYATAPAPPELTVLQVMPSSAYAGDEVLLIGQCFSSSVDENEVTINGVKAEVKEVVSSSQLRIIIPDTQEGTYPIRVKVGNKEANSPLFTYLHIITLTTTSLTPITGNPGDEVVLTGEGFGSKPSDVKVTVNGKEAEVKEVTPGTLTIVMPENEPGRYPVVVTTEEKTVDNLSFTYLDKTTYTVATVAGSGTAGSANGTGAAASFKFPETLSLAPDGSIWIVERNNAVRRMDKDFNVTTVASGASFKSSYSGAFDKNGNLYVANKDLKNIVKVTANGTTTVFTCQTTFSAPMGIAFDNDNCLYVADRDAKKIFKLTIDGELRMTYDMSDEKQGPCAIAVDKKGRVLAANGASFKLFMFETDGTKRTIFGNGIKPVAETYSDGEPGDLSKATMGIVFGSLSFDDSGTLYFGDWNCHTIRSLTPDANGDYSEGTLKTIAGLPLKPGKTDGAGQNATFKNPAGLLVNGNIIYVADEQNNLIRSITINK